MKIDGKDIWLGRNQPNGYWKVGNPLLKLSVVVLMLFGVLLHCPSLTIQCSVLILFMVMSPFKPKTKFQNIIFNLGIGSLLVGLVSPDIIPYKYIDIDLTINNIATINLLKSISVVLMIIALLVMTKAITTRDYTWLMSLIPNKLKKHTSGYVYSFSYASIRLLNIISETNISILSRGKHLPISFYTFKSIDNLIDTFGLWLCLIFREYAEMAITIEYFIISKIKPIKRTNPVINYFSTTDYNIAGIILLTILIPRIISVFK